MASFHALARTCNEATAQTHKGPSITVPPTVTVTKLHLSRQRDEFTYARAYKLTVRL